MQGEGGLMTLRLGGGRDGQGYTENNTPENERPLKAKDTTSSLEKYMKCIWKFYNIVAK